MTTTERSHVSHFYDSLVAGGATPWGKGLSSVLDLAKSKAKQYHQLGTAYVDLQPGNGSSYKMVLHDLVRLSALHIAESATDSDEHGIDAYRVSAYPKSMAARLGGELLVSLPDNFGGRCITVGLPAMVTPDYAAEKFGVGLPDATVLSVFLTAFSDALDVLRAGVQTGAEDHNAPHTYEPDPHLLGKFCKACSLPPTNKRHK